MATWQMTNFTMIKLLPKKYQTVLSCKDVWLIRYLLQVFCNNCSKICQAKITYGNFRVPLKCSDLSLQCCRDSSFFSTKYWNDQILTIWCEYSLSSCMQFVEMLNFSLIRCRNLSLCCKLFYTPIFKFGQLMFFLQH